MYSTTENMKLKKKKREATIFRNRTLVRGKWSKTVEVFISNIKIFRFPLVTGAKNKNRFYHLNLIVTASAVRQN